MAANLFKKRANKQFYLNPLSDSCKIITYLNKETNPA